MTSNQKTIVTVITTVAALLAIMAFAGSTVWQATMAIMGVEQRLEERMERRLTRLEQKVRDDKDKLDRELEATEAISRLAQSQGSYTAMLEPRQISMGETRQSRLSESDDKLVDDSFFELWTISFDSVPSSPVVIEMKSDELDSYLFLLHGDSVVHADDTGNNLDARLTLTNIDTTSPYAIVANTYVNETGRYTLTVRALDPERE
ncbi:MAG: hypothetical protein OXL34_14495 [Gemmatimonadota bacterium]|nr:hypothetical protein [Gemmatimonadota bacterium]